MHLRDRQFAHLTTAELHDILKLRLDVSVAEQARAYPELARRHPEPTTRHVWMANDVGVVAYVRVLHDDDARRICRVATREDARSGGLAGALMEYVLDSTDGPWVLDAQSYLAGWYRERGFEDDGEEFVEYGIAHLPMRRES